MQIDDANKMIVAALMAELLSSKLLFPLSKNPPSLVGDLMVKAQHMNAEDTLSTKRKRDVRLSSQSDKRKREQQQTPQDRGGRGRESDINRRIQSRVNLPLNRFQNYIPLNAPVEQVFVHIKDDQSIKWPERIRAPPEKRSLDKYYRFHRDHGHDINDYFDLKEQIKALIQHGQLQRFIVERQQVRRKNTR